MARAAPLEIERELSELTFELIERTLSFSLLVFAKASPDHALGRLADYL